MEHWCLYDVVVTDAGLAGLASAYYLRRAAVSFVMLDEKGRVANGDMSGSLCIRLPNE